MIARCVCDKAAELGEPLRGLYYTEQTVLHVALGAEYLVLGMSLYKAGLTVLIRDETGKPNWLPIGLFEFDNQALPPDWEFALIDRKAASGGAESLGTTAEWGYQKLVRDAQHAQDVIERRPEALRIFFDELERRSAQS
jgi:hypothetical protein